MRRFLVLLIAIGLAHAQFDLAEGRLSACEESCCQNSSGAWDPVAMDCEVSSANFNEYHSCDGACLESASRDFGSGSAGAGPCCAPAIILAGIIAISISSRR